MSAFGVIQRTEGVRVDTLKHNGNVLFTPTGGKLSDETIGKLESEGIQVEETDDGYEAIEME